MPVSQSTTPLYTFMHPPKTAGSAINKWLEESPTVKLKFGVTECRKDPLLYPKHPYRSFVEDKWGPLGSVVCPIRNTWDRVVSHWCYYNKGSEVRSANNNVPFENFVQIHTEHQSHAMYDLMYFYREGDIILRHDRIEKDFKQIQDVFGDYRPLPVYNVTSQRLDYKDVYTSATKDIVYKRLKKEIDHFGFEF
jgi:hypothetical protein